MFCFFTAEVAVSAVWKTTAEDRSLPSNQHIADPQHYNVALLWAAHQLTWETFAWCAFILCMFFVQPLCLLYSGSLPSFGHQQFSAPFLPPPTPFSPGKPIELRLPPPLDKRDVGEGSYTCGGVETITHSENGVGDEEEWSEERDSSCFHRWKSWLVTGLWNTWEREGCGLLRLVLCQSKSVLTTLKKMYITPTWM